MDETKHSQYFLKEPWGIIHSKMKADGPPYIGIGQREPVNGWDESISQVLRPIYYAYEMIPKPHTHSVAEILYFIGADPMNFKEFEAEVEFTMGVGEDAETHIIYPYDLGVYSTIPPPLPFKLQTRG